eukprot:403336280
MQSYFTPQKHSDAHLKTLGDHIFYENWKNTEMRKNKSCQRSLVQGVLIGEVLHAMVFGSLMLNGFIQTSSPAQILLIGYSILGFISIFTSAQQIYKEYSNQKSGFDTEVREQLILEEFKQPEEFQNEQQEETQVDQAIQQVKSILDKDLFKDFCLTNYKMNGFNLKASNFNIQLMGAILIFAELFFCILAIAHSTHVSFVMAIATSVYITGEIYSYFGFPLHRFAQVALSSAGKSYVASICLGISFQYIIQGEFLNEMSFFMLAVMLSIDAFVSLSFVLITEKYLLEKKVYKFQDHLLTTIGFDNWKHGALYSSNGYDKIVALTLISIQSTLSFTMFICELVNFKFYSLNFGMIVTVLAVCYAFSCNYSFFRNEAPRQLSRSLFACMALTVLVTFKFLFTPSLAMAMMVLPFIVDCVYGYSLLKKAFKQENCHESEDEYYQMNGDYVKLEYQ